MAPKNPFLEGVGLFHGQVLGPEEELMRREEEGEDIWAAESADALPQEDQAAPEDVWSEVTAEKTSEDEAEPAEMDFGPAMESVAAANYDESVSHKGGNRKKSPNIVQINRAVAMTAKRKGAEKRKAA